jgi:F0F1-type ATP synthase membrane subunit b/b'
MMVQHWIVTSGCVIMALAGQIPLSLIAQTTSMPVSGTEEIFWRVGNTLGAMAILAWYFYRTQTVTIPEKDRQISLERAAAVEALKQERADHKAGIDQLVSELREERNSRMEVIRQCGKYEVPHQ